MRREELLTQLAQDQLSLDSALFRSCRSYLKAVTLFDHGTATEQATTLLTEFQQASARMVILFVQLEVVGQAVDARRQQRDLNLGRTRIAIFLGVALDNFGFGFDGHRHRIFPFCLRGLVGDCGNCAAPSGCGHGRDVVQPGHECCASAFGPGAGGVIHESPGPRAKTSARERNRRPHVELPSYW